MAIERIRYTINADLMSTKELGERSLEGMISRYRTKLESMLAEAYPGVAVEIDVTPMHIQSASAIEVQGDPGSTGTAEIRALADEALEAVFAEQAHA